MALYVAHFPFTVLGFDVCLCKWTTKRGRSECPDSAEDNARDY